LGAQFPFIRKFPAPGKHKTLPERMARMRPAPARAGKGRRDFLPRSGLSRFPPRGGALAQPPAPPDHENRPEAGKFALLFFCAHSNCGI